MSDLFKAVHITSHTLIGVGSGERPSDHGNCFSVRGDDEGHYNILNFNLENMEALGKLGFKFPVQCKRLGTRSAIIHDGRIGERWYDTRYCEVCTPQSLLPVTQTQRHERDVMRGARTEGNGFVTYYFDKKAEFP